MMPGPEIILKEKTVRNLLNMFIAHTAHTDCDPDPIIAAA